MPKKEKTIRFLQEQINKIDNLNPEDLFCPEFFGWKKNTARGLEICYGENSTQVNDFKEIDYQLFSLEDEKITDFKSGLETAKQTLKGMIEEINLLGLQEKKKPINSSPENIFNLNQQVNINIENALRSSLNIDQVGEFETILRISDQQKKQQAIVNFLEKLGVNTLTNAIVSLLNL